MKECERRRQRQKKAGTGRQCDIIARLLWTFVTARRAPLEPTTVEEEEGAGCTVQVYDWTSLLRVGGACVIDVC